MAGSEATYSRWSEAETARLLLSYAAGEPVEGIAQRIGRSASAVTNRLHYLRRTGDPRVTIERRRSRPWSTTEDAVLDGLLARGADLRACCDALDRPRHRIEVRVRALAEAERLSPRALRHQLASREHQPVAWTTEMDARLAAGWLAGDTLDALGNALGVPPAAVHYRVSVLRKSGQPLAPRKPRWTAEQSRRLARRREEGATLRQLEAEFGISRGTLTYHLRRLRERSASPPRR